MEMWLFSPDVTGAQCLHPCRVGLTFTGTSRFSHASIVQCKGLFPTGLIYLTPNSRYAFIELRRGVNTHVEVLLHLEDHWNISAATWLESKQQEPA
jgi:hypothetical protein